MTVLEEEDTIIVRNVENRSFDTYRKSNSRLINFLVLLYRRVIIGYMECEKQNITMSPARPRAKIMIIRNVALSSLVTR